MTRSVWKGPFTDAILIKKLLKNKLKPKVIPNIILKGKKNKVPKKMRINTLSRNSTIDEQFIGKIFGIHNGRIFVPITISEEMVSFKLGEFVPTRQKFFFKKKKLKKIVQKKKILQKTVIKKKK
jgi:small subunit ribosomal protein S19